MIYLFLSSLELQIALWIELVLMHVIPAYCKYTEKVCWMFIIWKQIFYNSLYDEKLNFSMIDLAGRS